LYSQGVKNSIGNEKSSSHHKICRGNLLSLYFDGNYYYIFEFIYRDLIGSISTYIKERSKLLTLLILDHLMLWLESRVHQYH